MEMRDSSRLRGGWNTTVALCLQGLLWRAPREIAWYSRRLSGSRGWGAEPREGFRDWWLRFETLMPAATAATGFLIHTSSCYKEKPMPPKEYTRIPNLKR